MSVKRVIYTSLFCPSVDEARVEDILRHARTNNIAAGITGVLIVGNGQVIQCLEGPAEDIDHLIAKISADDRHHAMCIVSEELDVKPLCPSFSMGFVPVAGEEISKQLGAIGVLPADVITEELTRDLTLATTFISGFVALLQDHGSDTYNENGYVLSHYGHPTIN